MTQFLGIDGNDAWFIGADGRMSCQPAARYRSGRSRYIRRMFRSSATPSSAAGTLLVGVVIGLVLSWLWPGMLP